MLERAGAGAGLDTVALTRQMEFLVGLGLGERIAALGVARPGGQADFAAALAARARLFRLIDPGRPGPLPRAGAGQGRAAGAVAARGGALLMGAKRAPQRGRWCSACGAGLWAREVVRLSVEADGPEAVYYCAPCAGRILRCALCRRPLAGANGRLFALPGRPRRFYCPECWARPHCHACSRPVGALSYRREPMGACSATCATPARCTTRPRPARCTRGCAKRRRACWAWSWASAPRCAWPVASEMAKLRGAESGAPAGARRCERGRLCRAVRLLLAPARDIYRVRLAAHLFLRGGGARISPTPGRPSTRRCWRTRSCARASPSGWPIKWCESWGCRLRLERFRRAARYLRRPGCAACSPGKPPRARPGVMRAHSARKVVIDARRSIVCNAGLNVGAVPAACEPRLVYLLVDVRPGAWLGTASAPVNLGIVLDISESMRLPVLSAGAVPGTGAARPRARGHLRRHSGLYVSPYPRQYPPRRAVEPRRGQTGAARRRGPRGAAGSLLAGRLRRAGRSGVAFAHRRRARPHPGGRGAARRRAPGR